MRLIELAESNAENATRIANTILGRLASIVAGTPELRAVAYDASRSSAQWCWPHERDLKICRKLNLDCDGETIVSHDPAGDAATQRALDVVAIGSELVIVHDALERLTKLLERHPEYTEQPIPKPSADPKIAPDGACRSCWRNNRHYEPIAVGRYRKYCTWCGEWKAANHGQLPPRKLLEMHHRGQKITSRDIAAAR